MTIQFERKTLIRAYKTYLKRQKGNGDENWLRKKCDIKLEGLGRDLRDKWIHRRNSKLCVKGK